MHRGCARIVHPHKAMKFIEVCPRLRILPPIMTYGRLDATPHVNTSSPRILVSVTLSTSSDCFLSSQNGYKAIVDQCLRITMDRSGRARFADQPARKQQEAPTSLQVMHPPWKLACGKWTWLQRGLIPSRQRSSKVRLRGAGGLTLVELRASCARPAQQVSLTITTSVTP